MIKKDKESVQLYKQIEAIQQWPRALDGVPPMSAPDVVKHLYWVQHSYNFIEDFLIRVHKNYIRYKRHSPGIGYDQESSIRYIDKKDGQQAQHIRDIIGEVSIMAGMFEKNYEYEITLLRGFKMISGTMGENPKDHCG